MVVGLVSNRMSMDIGNLRVSVKDIKKSLRRRCYRYIPLAMSYL